MKFWHNVILTAGITAVVSIAGAAVANADDYIDFGVNEAACRECREASQTPAEQLLILL